MTTKFKYIFGPVPSRRLGRSLGVDLVPHKTCQFDCVYCECGHTPAALTERREYVPTIEVLAELDELLPTTPEIDFITFSGGGEPTLHSGIGRVIKHLKTNYPNYKLCLLTNGLLLRDPAVAAELQSMDLVVPSLDAANERDFQIINRPSNGETLAKLLAGLKYFRRQSKAEMWLEIFMVPGVNDTAESLSAFRRIISELRPDKVQLNGLDRPGVVDWIHPPGGGTVAAFAAALAPVARVEAVGRFAAGGVHSFDSVNLPGQVREIISRRPCTMSDLVAATGVKEQVIRRILAVFAEIGQLSTEDGPRGEFYRFIPGAGHE